MPISGLRPTPTKTATTGAKNTVTRPSWIKDGPKAIPMPTPDAPGLKTSPAKTTTAATKSSAPATKTTTTAAKTAASNGTKDTKTVPSKTTAAAAAANKKDTKVVVPEDTDSSEYEYVTDSDQDETEEESDEEELESKFKLPVEVKLKPVEKPAPKVQKSPSQDRAGKFVKPTLKRVPKIDEIPKEKEPPKNELPEKAVLRKVEVPALKEPKEEEKKFVRPPLKKVDSTTKRKDVPPPPPPMCPPPPPPPGLAASNDVDKKPMTDKQKEVLEKLKTRPRRRPDWSDMMKEVEGGKKLRHVQCNDRSQPVLKAETIACEKGQFIYETEKANVHNALLQQIQGGLKLKPTKTNDRSKPVLEGLRKFRRQMTVEEQIQKSESRAQLAHQGTVEDEPLPLSGDEMDDIDKLRDDLQSTKQMLALELRNKEAQDRENKRLLAKIQTLEDELAKSQKSPSDSKTGTKSSSGDQALLKSMKSDVEDAQKQSKTLEKKYQETAAQLDVAKSEIEDQKKKIALLERKLAQGSTSTTSSRRPSEAIIRESSPEPEIESSGDESDDEKKTARLTRRVKAMRAKLLKLKDKQKACRKERESLRVAVKKNQQLLKDEKKNYKKLQREVEKMAALMKDEDDEDEEKAAKPSEPEDDDEDEETESESESDDDDTESESEAEDAPLEKKKNNYVPRLKRHEGRLSALKKGSVLLQANVDRIVDEINKLREESVTLQHDLDSVLSELG